MASCGLTGGKMGIENKTDAITLRVLREIKGLSRKDAGILLGLSHKTVQKLESGQAILYRSRIEKTVKAYGLTYEDFLSCREGQSEQIRKRLCHKTDKATANNRDRRFNKRIITKEAQVLKVLRKLKNLSQRQASRLCGYHKTAICFIENGRVELYREKIVHIVKSYGFTMEDFEYHMKSESFVTDIQDECISIIRTLGEEKLKAVHPLLLTFKQ